jgi:hypothetical protein
MDRILVDSSNLVAVGYDKASEVLEVEFRTGSVYHYLEVPDEKYQGLMSAVSKGKYFHDHIINQYDFEEVES